jgi:hypothetical protein
LLTFDRDYALGQFGTRDGGAIRFFEQGPDRTLARLAGSTRFIAPVNVEQVEALLFLLSLVAHEELLGLDRCRFDAYWSTLTVDELVDEYSRFHMSMSADARKKIEEHAPSVVTEELVRFVSGLSPVLSAVP